MAKNSKHWDGFVSKNRNDPGIFAIFMSTSLTFVLMKIHQKFTEYPRLFLEKIKPAAICWNVDNYHVEFEPPGKNEDLLGGGVFNIPSSKFKPKRFLHCIARATRCQSTPCSAPRGCSRDNDHAKHNHARSTSSSYWDTARASGTPVSYTHLTLPTKA